VLEAVEKLLSKMSREAFKTECKRVSEFLHELWPRERHRLGDELV
jgi:hypothetical protein